jgi:hypothetical protein
MCLLVGRSKSRKAVALDACSLPKKASDHVMLLCRPLWLGGVAKKGGGDEASPPLPPSVTGCRLLPLCPCKVVSRIGVRLDPLRASAARLPEVPTWTCEAVKLRWSLVPAGLLLGGGSGGAAYVRL